MTGLLTVVLIMQFRLRGYKPSVYWLAVVLISVVGTELTDYLDDQLGLGLLRASTIFAFPLGVTFFVWQRSENTVSIHSIFTRRCEAFYWLAVLFTFALGTAAGDLLGLKMQSACGSQASSAR